MEKEQFLREFEKLASHETTGRKLKELLRYFNENAMKLKPNVEALEKEAKAHRGKYRAWLKKTALYFGGKTSTAEYNLDPERKLRELAYKAAAYPLESGQEPSDATGWLIGYERLAGGAGGTLWSEVYDLFYTGIALDARRAWRFFGAYLLLSEPPLNIVKNYLGDSWNYDLKERPGDWWQALRDKIRLCVGGGELDECTRAASESEHDGAVMRFVGKSWPAFHKCIREVAGQKDIAIPKSYNAYLSGNILTINERQIPLAPREKKAVTLINKGKGKLVSLSTSAGATTEYNAARGLKTKLDKDFPAFMIYKKGKGGGFAFTVEIIEEDS